MRSASKLNWLLAPVLTGAIVAFIFILGEYWLGGGARQKAGQEAPVSGQSAYWSDAGGFREKENQGDGSPGSPGTQTRGTVPLVPSPNPGTKKEEEEPENLHLNRQTANLNVLYLGVDGDKLLMCAVHTINYRDKMQTGAVFIPTLALVPGESYTFARLYQAKGVEGVKTALAAAMEIDFNYHVLIQRAILAEVEKLIGPIHAGGEKVDLQDLFTMQAGPRDQEILGALLGACAKPQVFLINLPRLILSAGKHIATDFSFAPNNLMLHYKVVRHLEPAGITKVVLPVRTKMIGGKPFPELQTYPLQNAVYELTR